MPQVWSFLNRAVKLAATTTPEISSTPSVHAKNLEDPVKNSKVGVACQTQ